MQTKAPAPVTFLGHHRQLPLLELYFELNALKLLFRQGWLRAGLSRERTESVAEHTLFVALLSWFLADGYFPELDANRVLRMALLHDLGEAHVGDLTPHDDVPKVEKARRERAAVAQLLGKLPRGETYVALWEEYETGTSLEAKLVREVDRLEMGLQACVYELQGAPDLSAFFASAEKVVESAPLQDLLAQAKALRPRPSGAAD
jgi:putative hydrolase of HD superfamily